MFKNPVVSEVRTARCTISDVGDFLHTLRTIAAGCNTHVICFNADMMAGKAHVLAAVRLAVRAFEAGENISNTLEMECLLYAAGSRQCSIAAAFGIHEGENRLSVCCVPEQAGIWIALEPIFCFMQDDRETINQEKRLQLMRYFEISPEELDAAGGIPRLVDLVLERVALLQVTR